MQIRTGVYHNNSNSDTHLSLFVASEPEMFWEHLSLFLVSDSKMFFSGDLSETGFVYTPLLLCIV
jgi:hypothetical protein